MLGTKANGATTTNTAQLLGLNLVTVSERVVVPSAVDLSSTDAIVRAQSSLKELGYYHGKITGRLNDDTHDALKDFQHDRNLRKTGYLDYETARQLGIIVP